MQTEPAILADRPSRKALRIAAHYDTTIDAVRRMYKPPSWIKGTFQTDTPLSTWLRRI